MVDQTAYAAVGLLFRRRHKARPALGLALSAVEQIDQQQGAPSPQLLRLASECAERDGDGDLQLALLERALERAADDSVEHAHISVLHTTADLARGGDPEQAPATLRAAASAFHTADDDRSAAATKGKIADVLQQRGETDEALRIRREEQLPVYERLGDVREQAITKGKIADVLQQGGETDEALRIHLEERLPAAQDMQDADLIVQIRFACAHIRIDRDGLQKGEAQLIADELAESYQLLTRLQRADGIAIVGAMLGQVLAAAGASHEAAVVLSCSAAAFEQIGDADAAAQMCALAEQVADPGRAEEARAVRARSPAAKGMDDVR